MEEKKTLSLAIIYFQRAALFEPLPVIWCTKFFHGKFMAHNFYVGRELCVSEFLKAWNT